MSAAPQRSRKAPKIVLRGELPDRSVVKNGAAGQQIIAVPGQPIENVFFLEHGGHPYYPEFKAESSSFLVRSVKEKARLEGPRSFFHAHRVKMGQRIQREASGAAWKIAAFRSITSAVHFGAKRSTPYAKGSTHDFMHAKILVADDYVYAGSFNLSHSGESNAENVIQIESAEVADMCAAYIDRVAARYGGAPLKVA